MVDVYFDAEYGNGDYILLEDNNSIIKDNIENNKTKLDNIDNNVNMHISNDSLDNKKSFLYINNKKFNLKYSETSNSNIVLKKDAECLSIKDILFYKVEISNKN